jgi:phosphoribosylamine--glycine ligase
MTQNILLLGSGGRESALAWKLTQSLLCGRLYIAPGNGGTSQWGENVALSPTDFKAIEQFCAAKDVKLIVVGPEDPLVAGVEDYFEGSGIRVVGPSQEAAQLEGSKAFAKKFMARHSIPTAQYREFSEASFEEGLEYLKTHPLPIVLKADGLAAGKGVVIAQTHQEALDTFREMIAEKKFGDASARVVVEQFLDGIELSVFALTDGESYVLFPEAKDYKRIGEGDTGLNTGGMGAVSPVPFAGKTFMEQVEREIVRPTIEGFKKEGIRYRGFVFFGLIKVGDAPYVIEYNCRMGDPETEVVMPRLEADLVALCNSLFDGTLAQQTVRHSASAAATVMLVSGGYPEEYGKGFPIAGLEDANSGDTMVFQAGTAAKDGQIITSGGRVLAITALAPTLPEALAKSYQKASGISFQDVYFREDIGWEFL